MRKRSKQNQSADYLSGDSSSSLDSDHLLKLENKFLIKDPDKLGTNFWIDE